MTSKRNENRQTEVKFMFWNPEEGGTPYEKTEKIPYTRSEAIAQKTLVEMFPNCMIQVIANSLKQEEIKRTVYNSQLVFENMIADYETEEYANELCTENETVIPYVMYEYEAQVWLCDKTETEYKTETVFDSSPIKMTKGDAKTFIKMSAEDLFFGFKAIGTHNLNRSVRTRFAIVANADLEKCVKES